MLIGYTSEQIIEAVINNLELEGSSDLNKYNILNKLVPELEKIKAVHLVKISNVCVELIRDPESTSKTRYTSTSISSCQQLETYSCNLSLFSTAGKNCYPRS